MALFVLISLIGPSFKIESDNHQIKRNRSAEDELQYSLSVKRQRTDSEVQAPSTTLTTPKRQGQEYSNTTGSPNMNDLLGINVIDFDILKWVLTIC